jgi:hypothetical protein
VIVVSLLFFGFAAFLLFAKQSSTMNHHDDSPTAALSQKLLSGAPETDPEEVHVIMDEATTAGAVGIGEKQPNQFRDAWAAILFVYHYCALFYISFVLGFVISWLFNFKSYV